MNRRLFAASLLSLALPALAGAQAPAAADSNWVARSGIYEVFVQDFSPAGNLRGVMDGLGRIDSAGANVVWLMPVHPYGVLRRKEPLGSPYAVRDYRGINPAFGTADDFRALVRAVHARGMKIILDWVPDHTSWDHDWITRHPEYYVKDERGEISVPRDADGRLTDWTDVAQLDYRNAELRRAMIGEMRYWLEEFGIDGYRMDVAGFVPSDFWREALPQLRAAAGRPIMLLAEWGTLEMHRAGFELSYGWDGYSRLKNVWTGTLGADSMIRAEIADLHAMPAGGMRLRFSTNHDETAWDNPPVIRFGGSAGARAAFTAMALLPGRPMLYNGQEVESPQKLPLFDRMPVRWDQPRAEGARAFYRRVMRLARTHPAFLGRALDSVATSAPRDVIAYRRGNVLVLVNARNRATRVAVRDLELRGAVALVGNPRRQGSIITLPPYGALVLELAVTAER